jgi:hypothetical protein
MKARKNKKWNASTRWYTETYFQFCACGNLIFSAPFVEKAVFSPRPIFGSFIEKRMAIVAWVCVVIYYSSLFVCMSVYVPVQCYFNSVFLGHVLKSGIVIPPSNIVLLAQDFFGYLNLLCFHMCFRIGFSFSVKNVIEILIGMLWTYRLCLVE